MQTQCFHKSGISHRETNRIFSVFSSGTRCFENTDYLSIVHRRENGNSPIYTSRERLPLIAVPYNNQNT